MDVVKIGGIVSLLIGVITLFQKLKSMVSGINQILDSVKENSRNVKKLSAELEDNNNLTRSIADRQDKIIKSTKDVIRQHIIEKTNVVISRGGITEEEIYVLTELYNDYKVFGGNSTVDTRFKMAMKLPIIKNDILEV